MWYTCLRCEESFSTTDVAGAETAIEHECDPRKHSEMEERAFNGLQRGRQWQVCPNPTCKRRVELSEGCNHMRCECRTHFCFICGKPVRDGEGHWREQGGCPRFGQRGSNKAVYDEHDIWNDNDDVSDDERAQNMQRNEYDDQEAQLRAYDMQIQIVAEEIREREAAEAARLADLHRRGEEDVPRRERRCESRRRRRPRERHVRFEENDQWHERRDARRREEDAFRDRRELYEWEHQRHRGFGAFMNNVARATEYFVYGRSNRPHL